MNREEMRYKLNEVRMMINDGEHTEEQGILVEIIKELDKAESAEPTCMIEKSNFSQEQYKTDLQSAYDCGYNKALSGNKGEWIEHEIEGTLRWLTCSKCGFEYINRKDNFCPNCGADMRGE